MNLARRGPRRRWQFRFLAMSLAANMLLGFAWYSLTAKPSEGGQAPALRASLAESLLRAQAEARARRVGPAGDDGNDVVAAAVRLANEVGLDTEEKFVAYVDALIDSYQRQLPGKEILALMRESGKRLDQLRAEHAHAEDRENGRRVVVIDAFPEAYEEEVGRLRLAVSERFGELSARIFVKRDYWILGAPGHLKSELELVWIGDFPGVEERVFDAAADSGIRVSRFAVTDVRKLESMRKRFGHLIDLSPLTAPDGGPVSPVRGVVPSGDLP